MVDIFDFKSIRLSKIARTQLEACQRTAPRETNGSRAGLINQMLIVQQIDLKRGFYRPLATHIYVPKKLTTNISNRVPAVVPATGTDILFFTNALGPIDIQDSQEVQSLIHRVP